MAVKFTKHFLNKLEDLLSETEYSLRYERGNFKSGFCVLKEDKLAIVNKFYTLEGKISCIVEIVRQIPIDAKSLSQKNRACYQELSQADIQL